MVFSVDQFAAEAKKVMATTESVDQKQNLLNELMMSTMKENSVEHMIKTLDAAVPPGANIAEMIIFADSELTMLWGQIPPRFQSAIHNHTIFACICPIVGEERNIIFQEEPDGSLKQVKDFSVKPGEVLNLAADDIHCIENLSDEPSRALHCYGGNFKTISDQRDLWDWNSKKKIDFSLEAVMKQSIARMAAEKNEAGLKATAAAIPKVKPMIDEILADS